jgi:hypothetical protein
MNAEPDPSSPPRAGAATSTANTAAAALAVTPTPTADIGPDESVTQTATVAEPKQESGLPASAPVKVPGFENLDTLLNEKDLRSRGVFVLMHQEILRLRDVIAEKSPFERRFYEEKQQGAVLEEQLKSEKEKGEIKGKGELVADVWFGLAMAAGGALVCHADAMPEGHVGAKVGFVVLAVILAGAGAITKWVLR